jgi:hypothetical protein
MTYCNFCGQSGTKLVALYRNESHPDRVIYSCKPCDDVFFAHPEHRIERYATRHLIERESR